MVCDCVSLWCIITNDFNSTPSRWVLLFPPSVLNTVTTSPPNSSLTDFEDLKISPKCHMSVKKENDWLLKL